MVPSEAGLGGTGGGTSGALMPQLLSLLVLEALIGCCLLGARSPSPVAALRSLNKCLLDPAETWDTEKFEQTLLDSSLCTHLVHTIVLSMVTALFLE